MGRLGSRSGAFRLLSVLLGNVAVAAACGHPKQGRLTATDFVGDQECLACHPERASYLTTAPHLTSTLPSRSTIAGTFAEDEQILNTSNPYFAIPDACHA
jgi:hypothetical protein